MSKQVKTLEEELRLKNDELAKTKASCDDLMNKIQQLAQISHQAK